MKNWELSRENILAAPLPTYEGDSYTVIPHSTFLNELRDAIEARGLKVVEERYLSADKYKIITGNFRLAGGEDREMSPSISFVNSYNKTRIASIHASALVLVCKNGAMASTEHGRFARKHNGNALEDLRESFTPVLDGMEKEFKRLQTNRDEMKSIELSKKIRAQLVGDMVINESLITSTQLNILKREIDFSTDFKDSSLWSFYNHVTQSFHDSHPLFHDKQHIKFHTYISDKFNLTGSRGLYGEKIEDIDFSSVTPVNYHLI